MIWNWQKADWPRFNWRHEEVSRNEATFLQRSGVLTGIKRHFQPDDQTHLLVDLISGEAIKTSEIEGELLNREGVQSSIRRNFGLTTDHRKVKPAERRFYKNRRT